MIRRDNSSAVHRGSSVQDLIAQQQQLPSYGSRSVFDWERGQTAANIGNIDGQ